jgi:mannose-6-phosphate isomerase-like protein (cupin superfamily)/pyrroloquinoline quinone (PQQ) biosynthesis protein C
MLAIKENSDLFKHEYSKNKIENQIERLKEFSRQHKIWCNALLTSCEKGELTFSDFQFLFAQYYLYSKNFKRLIAGLMVNCENDYYRSKLSENLWEEGGGSDVEQRHAEIFRYFLKKHLKIESLDNIVFETYTEKFVENYLNICLNYKPLEASAVLSVGTEGIVSKLYEIFRKGLIQAGLKRETLKFFDIHIGCDDEHALTLEEILVSYSHEENWFERSKLAITKALDLRDTFFTKIYQSLKLVGLNQLIRRASHPAEKCSLPSSEKLRHNVNFAGNQLYYNKERNSNIHFNVERLPFNAEVLDPRLVLIPPGCTNENHSHAHETVFLILAGNGAVIIENYCLSIKAGDIVFVPRWLKHQTRNSGNEELRFFAVTDYGFTKCFPGNNESIYRLNKIGVIPK